MSALPQQNLHIKPYVLATAAGSLGVLLVVKLILRPWILSLDGWLPAKVFVLSFPSYVEAVVVSTISFWVLSLVRRSPIPLFQSLTEHTLFVFTMFLVGSYVISQELLPQNLGGNNVVDPWDVLASICGLATMAVLFVRFRFLEERS